MQPSAFDEALEQPFLSERTQKKKWSILSSVSSQSTVTMKTMLDESDYDDLEDPFAGLVAANETVQLIPTETIIFGDDALAQERHGELLGINASLKQINTIHQGKKILNRSSITKEWKRSMVLSFFLLPPFSTHQAGNRWLHWRASYLLGVVATSPRIMTAISADFWWFRLSQLPRHQKQICPI